MARERLIIGLGNPGQEYEGTRHNIGFTVVDAVAEKTGVTYEAEQETAGRWLKALGAATRSYDIGWGKFRSYPFGLAKPLTYMNRSGSVVAKLINKYQLDLQDVLIIFDDLNLPLGGVRLRSSGSAGGHNGLQDIIDGLNSDNLPRMRVGIGDNFPRGRQSNYVLSPFTDEEQPVVEETIAYARDAALTFVREGIVTAMDRYNRKQSPVSDEE